jgi:hypothetical protein
MYQDLSQDVSGPSIFFYFLYCGTLSSRCQKDISIWTRKTTAPEMNYTIDNLTNIGVYSIGANEMLGPLTIISIYLVL